MKSKASSAIRPENPLNQKFLIQTKIYKMSSSGAFTREEIGEVQHLADEMKDSLSKKDVGRFRKNLILFDSFLNELFRINHWHLMK